MGNRLQSLSVSRLHGQSCAIFSDIRSWHSKGKLYEARKKQNHCNAAAHYLSVAVSATAGSLPCSDLAIDAAPSPDQFKDCLEKMKKGVALEGRKLTMMVYCLAEAMKSIDQRHLSRAAEIALFRDERKGRILLRFRAVTNNLEIWSGMLGQERDAGTGGLNLTKATESILKRACGRWFGSGSDKQKPFVKWQLFNQVRQKITTITVDSAQDELVSGEIMRTALTPQQQVLCPNLRCVIRDKAHSSRRLTSRPWNADDALKETMNFFCGGPGSVARLIQYSPEIRRVFEKICEESDNAVRSAVVNFRSAQHRFESHSKTLGRTCLFLHACIRTCLHLVRTRKDAVGNKAKLWIQKLDAETALMAAMLADAADSSLQLTRKMDSEEVDPACMNFGRYNISGRDKGPVHSRRSLAAFWIHKHHASNAAATARLPSWFSYQVLGLRIGCQQRNPGKMFIPNENLGEACHRSFES